jgi:hypothetical protein
LRAPTLLLQHDQNFQLQNTDPQGSYSADRQLAQWNLQDLQPQRSLEFRVTVIPRAPVRQAVINAEITADGLRDGKQLVYEIGPNSSSGGLPSALPPGMSAPGPSLPSTSPSGQGLIGLPGTNAKPAIGSGSATNQRFSISIQPSVQTVRRGDIVTYEVRVENLASQPDQKVAMQVTIPSGSKLVSAKAVGLDYLLSRDGTTIAFTPIQFFRARDSFVYTIQFRHDEPSPQTITAAVKSLGQSEPLSTTLLTRVQ